MWVESKYQMKTYLPSNVNIMQCVTFRRVERRVTQIMNVKAEIVISVVSFVIELNDILS